MSSRIGQQIDVLPLHSWHARSLRIAPRMIFVLQKSSEPTGVRYLFVIYGFSVAETENLGSQFLLGRAPKADHLEPF